MDTDTSRNLARLERLEQELALLRPVAEAALSFKEAGDRNYYKGMGTIQGNDPASLQEMRVAYQAMCAALDAWRKEHDDGGRGDGR